VAFPFLPRVTGDDKPPGWDRWSPAEKVEYLIGMSLEGRVAPPSPLPCRSGKLRGKNFSGLALHPKVVSDQNLARDLSIESEARQGNGREARKPPDRRLASADHCHHSN
jgi:hypothetical protein